MPRQSDLAKNAKMHQSRISMFETPGASNMTLETLSKLAATFRVGLIVKFVPFSEMLEWENNFSQDALNVTKIEEDQKFLEPKALADVNTSNIAPKIRWRVPVNLGHGLVSNYSREVVSQTNTTEIGAIFNEVVPDRFYSSTQEMTNHVSN
jgi:hypothetical protein